jgi:hypothetical protein
MLYRETQPAVSLRREQTKVLGLPTSHLALAAIGIGLLDMIVREPSLLGTGLFHSKKLLKCI